MIWLWYNNDIINDIIEVYTCTSRKVVSWGKLLFWCLKNSKLWRRKTQILSNLYPANVKQYLLTGYCCSYWGKRKMIFLTLDKKMKKYDNNIEKNRVLPNWNTFWFVACVWLIIWSLFRLLLVFDLKTCKVWSCRLLWIAASNWFLSTLQTFKEPWN